MRHADAEIQLMLANDRLAREWREAELAGQLAADPTRPSLRERAGQVIITVGERLAGQRSGQPKRGAARPSFG